MTTMLIRHPRTEAATPSASPFAAQAALLPAVTFQASTYTAEECLTWRILFDRQTALLYRRAPAAFFEGLRALGLNRDAPPDLAVLSGRLRALTGWTLRPAQGRVSDEAYLAGLARRELPVATWLRARRDTEFLPGPDLFHDVFGHLPLLAAEPAYAQLLTQAGQLAARQHRQGTRAAPWLTRLLWHTVEFGLLTPAGGGKPQVIGAALLSSAAELHRATSAATDGEPPVRRPFQVTDILATPMARAEYQQQYFEAADWAGLLAGVAEVGARLGVPAGTLAAARAA